MGFSEWHVLTRVEFPLALPLIFGGLRTAAVSVVATATIAPLVGVQSLGTPLIAKGVYGPAGQIGAAIASRCSPSSSSSCSPPCSAR